MTIIENNLPVDPKCLWTPSNPQDTQMEKFRVLMQTKYQDLKLGMNSFLSLLIKFIIKKKLG